MPLLISAAYFLLIVLVLVDIITRDNWQIRFLPKVTWVFIVIFLPLIGSVLWFTVGRQYAEPVNHGRYAESSRFLSIDEPPSPMSEEELIDSEITYHEKQARIRRLEADIHSRRDEGRAL